MNSKSARSENEAPPRHVSVSQILPAPEVRSGRAVVTSFLSRVRLWGRGRALTRTDDLEAVT